MTGNGFYRKYKREIGAYGLMSIPIVWWIVFFCIPFGMALYFSFTDLKLSIDQISKIGFFQYAAVFRDRAFWQALLNTSIWTVVMMIGNNFFGLLMALLIARLKRGRKLFLALLFWPTLVSAVVGSDITKMVFGADATSLANLLIGVFGIAPVPWLEQESTALFSLMVMPFLFGFSIKLIIYYTAIMSVPTQYSEAAILETNSYWKRVWYILLPLIKNAFVLNTLLSVIDGLKVLGPMQLVTDGANGTMSSILYIYQLAFESPQKGKASAAAFIVFAIILLVSILQQKLSGKGGDVYE